MRKQRPKWMAFMMALLLAACSGGETGEEPTGAASGSAGSAATAPDACRIVPATDIEQVLGIQVRAQPSEQLKSIATISQCSYEGAQDSRNILSVLVRVGGPQLDAPTNLKQYVDGLKTNMGDAYQIDPVEGLSGPAVWNPGMKQLTVFKGRALVILTMFETGAQDPLEAAKALGEKALARM